jgi:hypothetical protein
VCLIDLGKFLYDVNKVPAVLILLKERLQIDGRGNVAVLLTDADTVQNTTVVLLNLLKLNGAVLKINREGLLGSGRKGHSYVGKKGPQTAGKKRPLMVG